MAYSPQGLFLDFTVAQIEEIMERARQDILAGRVITSYSSTGTSVGKMIAMDIPHVLAECRFALQELDPERYPRPRRTARASIGTFRHRR